MTWRAPLRFPGDGAWLRTQGCPVGLSSAPKYWRVSVKVRLATYCCGKNVKLVSAAVAIWQCGLRSRREKSCSRTPPLRSKFPACKNPLAWASRHTQDAIDSRRDGSLPPIGSAQMSSDERPKQASIGTPASFESTAWVVRDIIEPQKLDFPCAVLPSGIGGAAHESIHYPTI